ncbi:MAG: hypothetical protein KIS77_13280 [Saprospiraceae bacterium]|nr:hypothetical protein [Saprospiraceae bacterium]
MRSGTYVLIIFICAISSSYSQNIFKNLEISLGFAIKEQDRRLFEFPGEFEVLYYEDTNLDFDYLVNMSKIFFPKKKFNLLSGISYSLFQTKFSRPFDHNYFSGLRTYELRYIDNYLQHSIILNIDPRIDLVIQKNSVYYVNFNSFVKLLFNKNIKDRSGNWHYNKWLFETNAFESNIGMGYRYKKIGINLAYRIFNIQKIDRVIFNQTLFKDKNPPFLEKEYEIRNDNKFWLIISYQIR